MIVGHLLLGVLGGLGALVAALVGGQPLWRALALYAATGLVVFLGSVVIVALRMAGRPAPPKRPLQPVSAKR